MATGMPAKEDDHCYIPHGPIKNWIFLLQSQTTEFCNKPTEVGAGNNPALTATFTETTIYITDDWKLEACHLFSRWAFTQKKNYSDSYSACTFMCSIKTLMAKKSAKVFLCSLFFDIPRRIVLFEASQVSPACPFDQRHFTGKTNKEHSWIDAN